MQTYRYCRKSKSSSSPPPPFFLSVEGVFLFLFSFFPLFLAFCVSVFGVSFFFFLLLFYFKFLFIPPLTTFLASFCFICSFRFSLSLFVFFCFVFCCSLLCLNMTVVLIVVVVKTDCWDPVWPFTHITVDAIVYVRFLWCVCVCVCVCAVSYTHLTLPTRSLV